jgi:hypothetical protein
MNDNELNRVVDLIWTTLNCNENLDKTRDQQKELIKPIIIELTSSSRMLGRRQILNYFDDEIKVLREKI